MKICEELECYNPSYQDHCNNGRPQGVLNISGNRILKGLPLYSS